MVVVGNIHGGLKCHYVPDLDRLTAPQELEVVEDGDGKDHGIEDNGGQTETVKGHEQDDVQHQVVHVVDDVSRRALSEDRVIVQKFDDREHQDRHQEQHDHGHALFALVRKIDVEQCQKAA